jgi:quinol monooxygenase YgiN
MLFGIMLQESKMSLIVLASVRFPPENMDKVRPLLRQMVEDTNKHDGCILYAASEDVSVPGTVRFSELWPDAETLLKHLDAPHMEPWKKLSVALGIFDRNAKLYDASGERPLASIREGKS